MATASTAPAPEIVNGPSRFTDSGFLEVTNTPHGDRSSNTEKPMAQISQAREQAPLTASNRQKSQDIIKNKHLSAEQKTHELIEIASNPLIGGVLGPNKDGRVRNPVPSKLKGKTNNKQGNFGVMHMGISNGRKETIRGKDAAAERVAAARKTSEATAYRAKAAQSSQYVSPTKRIVEGLSCNPVAICEPSSVTSQKKSVRTLAPEETKYQQARLLTLLRSINPITVVDQVCKAVAYFGGIPGAPPPEDGIFPQSVNTKETGALFIGWLAEIFPDISIQSSKSSHETMLKTDEKIKDPVKITENTTRSGNFSSEQPNPRNGFGFGPAVSGFVWGLPTSHTLVNNPSQTVNITSHETSDLNSSERLDQQNSFLSGKEKAEEESLINTNKRKRGRPKGSRNKKINSQQRHEDEIEDTGKNNVPTKLLSDVRSSNDSSNGGCQPDSQSRQISVKASLGLTTAEPNQTAQCGDFWPSSQQDNAPPKQSKPLSTNNELDIEEHAILEVLKQNRPEVLDVPDTPSISPDKNSNVAHTPETGQKRKRALSKTKSTPIMSSVPVPTSTQESPSEAAPVNLTNTNLIDSNSNPGSSNTTESQPALCSLPLNDDVPLGMAKDALQWLPNVNNSNVSGPSAKRPRQGKLKFPNSGESSARNSNIAMVRNPKSRNIHHKASTNT